MDDLARACLHLLENYDQPETINVGVGEDLPISELASLVADIVGYSGDIRWDTAMPDGTPRKLLDVTRLRELGWAPRITLREGITRTVADFRELVLRTP